MITTNSGDGVMSWTITLLIPSGTVFMFTVTAETTPSLTISPTIYGIPVITAGWTYNSTLLVTLMVVIEEFILKKCLQMNKFLFDSW